MSLNSKQLGGIIAIVFGILIFILPSIVNYLIALFLIIWGVVSFIPMKKKAKIAK